MAIGATWSEDDAQPWVSWVVGSRAFAVACELLLGPVVDVLERPHPEGGGDLNLRVLGATRPGWACWAARTFCVHQAAVANVDCRQAFPGHGSSDRNPDQEVSTISKSLTTEAAATLVPVCRLTAAGPDQGDD